MNGRTATRSGHQHPTMAPHGCYPTRGEDRWLTLAVRHEADWQRLCGVLGQPAWCQQPQCATRAGRLAHRDARDRHIAAWTCQQEAAQAAARVQEVGVPAGAVLTARDLVRNSHLKARRFWEVITHVEAGTHPLPGPAWKMSATPGSVRLPAPRLGEHNRFILQDLLGLSETQMQELKTLKVIGDEAEPEG